MDGRSFPISSEERDRRARLQPSAGKTLYVEVSARGGPNPSGEVIHPRAGASPTQELPAVWEIYIDGGSSQHDQPCRGWPCADDTPGETQRIVFWLLITRPCFTRQRLRVETFGELAPRHHPQASPCHMIIFSFKRLEPTQRGSDSIPAG